MVRRVVIFLVTAVISGANDRVAASEKDATQCGVHVDVRTGA